MRGVCEAVGDIQSRVRFSGRALLGCASARHGDPGASTTKPARSGETRCSSSFEREADGTFASDSSKTCRLSFDRENGRVVKRPRLIHRGEPLSGEGVSVEDLVAVLDGRLLAETFEGYSERTGRPSTVELLSPSLGSHCRSGRSPSERWSRPRSSPSADLLPSRQPESRQPWPPPFALSGRFGRLSRGSSAGSSAKLPPPVLELPPDELRASIVHPLRKSIKHPLRWSLGHGSVVASGRQLL